MEPLDLIVRSASGLSLSSRTGVASRLTGATFEVRVALAANGDDADALGSTKDWKAKTPMVKATKGDGEGAAGTCSWDDCVVRAAYPNPNDVNADAITVHIALRRDFGKFAASHSVGRTSMTLRELCAMDDRDGEGIELLLFDKSDGELVSAGDEAVPTRVRVSVGSSVPVDCRAGGGEAREYAKRLMIVTRGTRGDIQPFVALSRGLASMKNWDVTIVTELSYKDKIKNATKDLPNGIVRFRPSGGDTMSKVQKKVSQKAINLKVSAKQTDGMQKIFLARSEVEFFGSEPAIYHWAAKERPDLLMFGFTVATMTLVASEALKIPVVGFVLQPTSIPSRAYPPVLPLRESDMEKMSEDAVAGRHDAFKMEKFLMDNLRIQGKSKSTLRTRRGLEPYKSYETSTWQELKDKDVPLIVPISETMFGGKPDDWSEHSVLTDCIFLRGDAIPPVADDATAFVETAKASGGKIVILAFSSMPVSKTDICEIALKLIEECKERACVFALVGGQMGDPFPSAKTKILVDAAVANGRLFLAAGAPFGRLFPMADAVVLHGGLGTTSEALQAKLPTIVTGVLLLDQRFWGSRCKEMGVGPFGVHVDDFPDVCVDYVDEALEEGSAWRTNAAAIGEKLLEEAGDDPSGVGRNVECVCRMAEIARPYRYSQEEDESDATRRRDVAWKLLSTTASRVKGNLTKVEVNLQEEDLAAI